MLNIFCLLYTSLKIHLNSFNDTHTANCACCDCLRLYFRILYVTLGASLLIYFQNFSFLFYSCYSLWFVASCNSSRSLMRLEISVWHNSHMGQAEGLQRLIRLLWFHSRSRIEFASMNFQSISLIHSLKIFVFRNKEYFLQ